MPIILLIRHGENDVMSRGLAGRLPEVHLNQTGRRQAVKLAATLADFPLKAIYSSPLERAIETAEPTAAALHLEVQVRPGLNEIDYGALQGKTYPQARRFKVWRTVREDPARAHFPEGESFSEAQQRVLAEVEAIAAAHDEKDVIAIFTHADVIRLCLIHYLNMGLDDIQRLSIAPASISVVQQTKDQKKPRVLQVNQVLGWVWKKGK